MRSIVVYTLMVIMGLTVVLGIIGGLTFLSLMMSGYFG